MTTLADVKQRVIRLLGEEVGNTYPDPVAGTNTSSELLTDAVVAAISALASRYWKRAILAIEADPDATSVDVPEDLIEIEGIYDTEIGGFIPKAYFQIGETLLGTNQNVWTDFPTGTITYSQPMAEGGNIYYSAEWEIPTADDSVIEPPSFCLSYITLYATSFVQLKNANAQAELRQYGTKVDSGTPVMLPAKDMSDYFMKRAELEAQRLPLLEKGLR
jgi:hypothetical protein